MKGFREEHDGTRNSNCWIPGTLNLCSTIQPRKLGGVLERALSLSQESWVCGAASARNLILIFQNQEGIFLYLSQPSQVAWDILSFSILLKHCWSIIIACKHVSVSLLTSSLSSSNTFSFLGSRNKPFVFIFSVTQIVLTQKAFDKRCLHKCMPMNSHLCFIQ